MMMMMPVIPASARCPLGGRSWEGERMLLEELGFWILPPNIRLELQREEQGFGLAVHVCGLVMGACPRAQLGVLRKG